MYSTWNMFEHLKYKYIYKYEQGNRETKTQIRTARCIQRGTSQIQIRITNTNREIGKYKYKYKQGNTNTKREIQIQTWEQGNTKNPNWQARGGIEQDVLESYCWMYSTWNIPKEYKGACSGGDQVTIFPKFTILFF